MSTNPSPKTLVIDPARALAKLLRKARTCSDALLREESNLRHGDRIHELRVALRRLSVAGIAFADLLPKGMGRKLHRKARKLRRSAGKLRDDEVLRRAVSGLAKRDSRHATAAALVSKTVKKSRPSLLKDLRREVDRLEDSGFWQWAKDKVVHQLRPKHLRSATVSALAQAMIAAHVANLEAALAAARSEEDDDLHAARIAAKRVRYTIELFNLSDGNTDELLSSALSLQDGLGEIHDHSVLTQRCLAMAKKTQLSTVERAALKRLASAFRVQHKKAIKAFTTARASAEGSLETQWTRPQHLAVVIPPPSLH